MSAPTWSCQTISPLVLVSIPDICFYQIAIRKSYQVLTPIDGVVMINPVVPGPDSRWPHGGPYCAGVPASLLSKATDYDLTKGNDSYALLGGPTLSRLPCNRWDATDIGGLGMNGNSRDFFTPT